jgi:hypothetical protein
MNTLQELPLYSEDNIPEYDTQIIFKLRTINHAFQCFHWNVTGQTHFSYQDYDILIGDIEYVITQYLSVRFPEELDEDGFHHVNCLKLKKYILDSQCSFEQLIQQISSMKNYTFDPQNFVAHKLRDESQDTEIIKEMLECYTLPYNFANCMKRCKMLDDLINCTEDPEEVLQELRTYDSSQLSHLLDDISNNQRFVFCLFFVIYKIFRDTRCIPEPLIKKFDCDWRLFW